MCKDAPGIFKYSFCLLTHVLGFVSASGGSPARSRVEVPLKIYLLLVVNTISQGKAQIECLTKIQRRKEELRYNLCFSDVSFAERMCSATPFSTLDRKPIYGRKAFFQPLLDLVAKNEDTKLLMQFW